MTSSEEPDVRMYTPAFARVLTTQGTADVDLLSLTQRQVEGLLDLGRALVKDDSRRGHKTGQSHHKKMNRWWPFYKIFKEHELACAAYEYRADCRSGRTLMGLARAKTCTFRLMEIMYKTLPEGKEITALTFRDMAAQVSDLRGFEGTSGWIDRVTKYTFRLIIGKIEGIVPGRETISFTDQFQ